MQIGEQGRRVRKAQSEFPMAKSGNNGNSGAKPEEELPSEVRAAIFVAVRRSIRGLKAEVEAKRPRTVVEKHIHFDTREFADVLLALRKECDRAAGLLAELRAERERILRVTKPELF
jgi:hypothetical protein